MEVGPIRMCELLVGLPDVEVSTSPNRASWWW